MPLTLENKFESFAGTYLGGVIVLNDAVTLPEGTEVTITLPHRDLNLDMREEFKMWDKAGDKAWDLIAQWEAEEGSDPEKLA